MLIDFLLIIIILIDRIFLFCNEYIYDLLNINVLSSILLYQNKNKTQHSREHFCLFLFMRKNNDNLQITQGRTFRPPDPTRTCSKQAEKSPDSAGMHRKSPEVISVGNHRKKIRKISGGNTASMFRQFPVSSCRNRPVFFDFGIAAAGSGSLALKNKKNFIWIFIYCLLWIYSFCC